MRIIPILPLAAACAVAAPAAGQLHDLDIIPTVDPEGAIVTNRVVTTGEGQSLVPDRVFDADLVEFFGFPFTEDPGVNSAVNTFQPFTIVRLSIVDALRLWDGSSFDNVATDPTDPNTFITMEVDFGSTVIESPTTPGARVEAIQFAVSSLGDLHVHPGNTLPQNAPDGVYLLAFDLTSDEAGLAPSEPYYIVYNFNRTQDEQDEAIQWVRDNLLTPTPDLNADGVVDGADLGLLLGAWGACAASCEADLNADGVVDGADLGLLLGAWG